MGSLWIVELQVLFGSGTATDTNWVIMQMRIDGARGWWNEQFVNFGITPGFSFMATFTVFLARSTMMTFYAATRNAPPAGKNYKIDAVNLTFTRIA